MRTFPLMLGAVLVLSACEDEPDELSFSLSINGQLAGADAVQRSFAGEPSLAPPPATGLVIDLDQPVHWIEVERCTDSLCKPFAHGDYCFFEYAEIAWETAMGEEPEDAFDDALRGPPLITGSVTYGVQPEQAGWQSQAQPLLEGESYGLNVYVHEGCDDEEGDEWLCTAAIGCQYFKIEAGELVPFEPGRDD